MSWPDLVKGMYSYTLCIISWWLLSHVDERWPFDCTGVLALRYEVFSSLVASVFQGVTTTVTSQYCASPAR